MSHTWEIIAKRSVCPLTQLRGKNPYNLEVRSRNYLAIEERRRLLGYVTKID